MHHANVLIGDYDWARKSILGDALLPHPDITEYLFDRMSIADARSLVLEAQRKPVEKETRIILVYAEALPVETQNALLKLLEDPSPQVIFYLVIPDAILLLPTLRSRLFTFGAQLPDIDTDIFSHFKNLSHFERLALIGVKVKEEDGVWIQKLLDGIEHSASQTRKRDLLKDMLLIREYVSNQGSSKKMLLEHIALSL